MKSRVLVAAGVILLPIAWAASKDFNGRMWLAAVPALPTSGDVAYSQWIDDGQGALTPGDGFKNIEVGMNKEIAEQVQPSAPSQQQMTSAQQLMQQYSTPAGQTALRNMTPAQLMALSQQMGNMTGSMTPRTVSPEDQTRLQAIGNGVYSGKQQVMADTLTINKQVADLQTQWDAEAAPLASQESAAEQKLPVCAGEAGIPSDLDVSHVKLQYADKRIALAESYLPRFAPLVDKLRVSLQPEIDFGDDALAAWSQIQDPALKQQVSASAHGAEQQGFADVGMIEATVKNISQKAAQAVADKKAIQKKYAGAKGCS